MAEIVRMPKLSDTMTEGVVTAWHKEVGDAVKSGEVLAEIETDKATMEFESFTDGVLLHIGVPKGKTAAVDSVLAVLGKAGEDITKLLADAAAEAPAKEENEEPAPAKNAAAAPPAKVEAKEAAPAPVAEKSPTPVRQAAPRAVASNGRVKASPLARRLAEEKGIDLQRVHGSGDEGRVTKKDIEEFTGWGRGIQCAPSGGVRGSAR
jgi:pyruvate dehydrogenase E2 component (dihydrolipoamide acetyltransferase)